MTVASTLQNTVEQPADDRTRTVKRYQDLLAAEATFNTYSLDGRML